MRVLINTGLLVVASFTAPVAGYADELRFDVTVLPEFRKYQALLAYPGYAALALENNGLSPSPGNKIVVMERGRGIQLPNGTLTFTGRMGEVYSYEVDILIGMSNLNTHLSFPVVLDASSLGSGKMIVAIKLPLASLLPADFRARLDRKLSTVAGTETQTKLLAYLEQLRKQGPGAVEMASIVENILVDAYNRTGGPMAAQRDAEQALLRQDQWSLITTFVIWLLLVSALLLLYFRRQRHGKPA